MDWRSLLAHDLRPWLPGYRPLPPAPVDRPAETFDAYPKSVQMKIRNMQWKGPQYVNPRQWQVEMLFVLEQIRLCARAGLPLHQGLDAAARNEFETLRACGPGFRLRLTAGLLLAFVAFVAFGAFLLFGPVVSSAVAPFAFLAAATISVGMADGALGRSRRAAVCGSLVQSMNRGLTLSESMARLSTFFPQPIVSLVAMGETADRLAETVEQLNKDVLKRFAGNRQLTAWLVYFCMILVMQLAIVGFIAYRVAPVMLEIKGEIQGSSFAGNGAPSARDIPFPLPLPSIEFLVDAPPWVRASFIVLGLVAVTLLAGLAWRRMAQVLSWRRWSGSTLELYVPVFRKLLALQNLGAAATMAAQLLKAGIPLERALACVAESGLHPAYAAWIESVRERVRGGESFSDACAMAPSAGSIPPSFHDAVAMGEHLGQLPDGLAYIGEKYVSDVDDHFQWWMNWSQVGSILLMGYLVLSIEVGVFGMILDVVESIMP